MAPLASTVVPLADALGLVVAEDVLARLAVPRFDHAAMDGYAVRAADIAAAPVTLPVAGVVAAGDAWSGELEVGTALRIMTGAPVPSGADLVVPFEWTDRGESAVSIGRPAVPGQHIRMTGEDVVAGEVAVAAGTRLRPAHLGLLASVGCAEVVVRPRPRVAVIATGAELVAPVVEVRGAPATSLDTPGARDDLAAGAVPDSNSITIAAAVEAVGGRATVVGPAPDETDAFLTVLTSAAEDADLVVTTGGISAGDHDVVKAALADRDAMWFGPVAVKPGKPQGSGVIGTSDGRTVPVVCLPGTPVAAYSSFLLFGVPAIRALEGRASIVTPVATLGEPVEANAERTLVLPGRIDEAGRVVVLRGHAGHSQRLLADADVLVVVPPGGSLAAGDPVDVVRLEAT